MTFVHCVGSSDRFITFECIEYKAIGFFFCIILILLFTLASIFIYTNLSKFALVRDNGHSFERDLTVSVKLTKKAVMTYQTLKLRIWYSI